LLSVRGRCAPSVRGRYAPDVWPIKSPSRLIQTRLQGRIAAWAGIAAGGLIARERRVAEHAAGGVSDKEAARSLFVSCRQGSGICQPLVTERSASHR